MADIDLTKRIIVKNLKVCNYSEIFQQMQSFTKNRIATTKDELWQLEHYPVFTLGQAGSSKHLIKKTEIPVIKCDRGGQITYHGPGQLIIYFLSDLKRKNLSLKKVIYSMQQAVIDLLAIYKINSTRDNINPGIYIDKKKICSLGLKVVKGCTYHGLSLNVDMDLKPFNYINPCGQKDLCMTQLSNFNININFKNITTQLTNILLEYLDYTDIINI